jgi:hypothetical protein
LSHLELETGKLEAAVRQTMDDFTCSRKTVFTALTKFRAK